MKRVAQRPTAELFDRGADSSIFALHPVNRVADKHPGQPVSLINFTNATHGAVKRRQVKERNANKGLTKYCAKWKMKRVVHRPTAELVD
jgi:hypothetical protein